MKKLKPHLRYHVITDNPFLTLSNFIVIGCRVLSCILDSW